MIDLGVERKHIERLAQTAREQMANLSLFNESEQERQKVRILEPLQTAVGEAIAAAGKVEKEAAKLEALQHEDPLALFTDAELERMNSARPFVNDEVSELQQAPGQLVARLGSVAQGSDRVAKYLYLKSASPIVSASVGTPWAQELHRSLTGLDESLNGAERALAGECQTTAQELRKRAAELSFFAGSTLAELDGSQAASDAARLSRYQGFF